MVSCTSTKNVVYLAQCCAELILVSTNEFCMLLTVEHKIELGDRGHLEGHCRITILISLYGTEHNL